MKSSMESHEVHTRSSEAFTPSDSTSIFSKTMSDGCRQRKQMERKLLSVLSEMMDVAPEGLAGQSSLDELDTDPLLMMEVASEIDSAFGISIPQEALQSFFNVDSVVDYLYRHGGVNSFHGPTNEFALSPHLKVIIPTTSRPRSQPLSPEIPTEFPGTSGDASSQLARILGIHPGCSATEFHASTDLADKGLDLLLWIEVISDIEKIFEVIIELYLTAGSKYGDLCDKLVRAIGRTCSS